MYRFAEKRLPGWMRSFTEVMHVQCGAAAFIEVIFIDSKGKLKVVRYVSFAAIMLFLAAYALSVAMIPQSCSLRTPMTPAQSSSIRRTGTTASMTTL